MDSVFIYDTLRELDAENDNYFVTIETNCANGVSCDKFYTKDENNKVNWNVFMNKDVLELKYSSTGIVHCIDCKQIFKISYSKDN